MEIMNNVNAAAVDSWTALLQANEVAKAQLEKDAELEKIRRQEVLQKDTLFIGALAQSNYLAKMSGTIGKVSELPTVTSAVGKNGVALGSRHAALYVLYRALEDAEKAAQNHIVIYMNDVEALRVQSVVATITKNGVDAALAGTVPVFTEKQLEYMEQFEVYDETYKKMVAAIFMKAAKVMKSGKHLSVRSFGSIFGWELRNQGKLPDSLIGAKATFKNGFARITVDGKIYNLTLNSNFKLNGIYKLEKSKSSQRIIVARNGKPVPETEQFVGNNIFESLNTSVRVQESKDKKAANNVEAEEAIDAVADEAEAY